MLKYLSGAIISAFALMSSAHAEMPIVNPGWHALTDISFYVPERALRFQVSGWARLRCMVGDDLKGKDCIVVGEYPAQFGFGQAALRIIGKGAFDPTANGRSIVGRVVVKKMNFSVGPNTISDWVTQPRVGDIAKVHPKRADGYGMADVECSTAEDIGLLENCVVKNESPPGEGFGDAALSLRSLYKKKDTTPRLTIGFFINWISPGSTALPAGTRIDLTHLHPGSASPTPEPIATVFDASLLGGTVEPLSDVFIETPNRQDIERARPSGAEGDATVSLKCDVGPSGSLKNCTTLLSRSTDARYLRAADSLLGLYKVAAPELAKAQLAAQAASYHVNWEP